MKNQFKKIILVLFIAAGAVASVFSQNIIPEDNAAKTLASNSKVEVLTVSMYVNRMKISDDGTVSFPVFEKQKFTVTTEMSNENLDQRIHHMTGDEVKVVFRLISKKPKIYRMESVEGLETVEEYKARSESEANEKAGNGYVTNAQLTEQKAKNKAVGKGEISDAQAEKEISDNQYTYGSFTNEELNTQRTANKQAGRGEITDFEANEQRTANKRNGDGEVTDEELKTQVAANKAAGLGDISDFAAEKERTENEKKGYGKVTSKQAENQCDANDKAGDGYYTDAQVAAQRAENQAKGLGPVSRTMADDQMTRNSDAGLGKITDYQAEQQRAANKAAGRGEVTDRQAENEIAANKENNLGELTNAQVEAQRAKNKSNGDGEILDSELIEQQNSNEAAGLGKISNAVADSQRKNNSANGEGTVTDVQLAAQRTKNEKAGQGKFSDEKIRQQKAVNKAAGLGSISNAEKTKQIAANKTAGKGAVTDYQLTSSYLKDAKAYEKQGKLCSALGCYYEFLSSNISFEDKAEAYEAYNKLSDCIKSGKPGTGTYNDFELHDQWKKLLIDTEKYSCTISIYDVKINELKKGDFNYTTKTANVEAYYTATYSDRYQHTIAPVISGYKKAKNKEWKDIPEKWPMVTVSAVKQGTCNFDGAYILRAQYNTQTAYTNAALNGFYSYNFNLVDSAGTVLATAADICPVLSKDKSRKPDPSNPFNNFIVFKNLPASTIAKIDQGKASVKTTSVKTAYGVAVFNSDTNKVNATLYYVPVSKSKYFVTDSKDGKNPAAETYKNDLLKIKVAEMDSQFVNIPGTSFAMLKTEVTRKMYGIFRDDYKSSESEDNLPAAYVSWTQAARFCNKASVVMGYKPVYAFNGQTDVSKWPEYYFTYSDVVTIDETADGYRLPTPEEWLYAARGGNTINCSSIEEWQEYAWIPKDGNTDTKLQPVAQKKPNAYGLYDMIGNVEELCTAFPKNEPTEKPYIGYSAGSNDYNYYKDKNLLEDPAKKYVDWTETRDYVGFRMIRAIK